MSAEPKSFPFNNCPAIFIVVIAPVNSAPLTAACKLPLVDEIDVKPAGNAPCVLTVLL
jgi:hypothetical protein